MTLKEIYIGSVGPFEYDTDDSPSDNQVVSRGELTSGATLEVLEVADITSPTELTGIVTATGKQVLCYKSGNYGYDCTLYTYTPTVLASNLPYVIASGSGAWVAIAGRFLHTTQSLRSITANQLVSYDGTKLIASGYTAASFLGKTEQAADSLLLAGQTLSYVLSTTNHTEGTNLFFTEARARASVSASAPVLYDEPSGVISISSSFGDTLVLGNDTTSGGMVTVKTGTAGRELVFTGASGDVSLTCAGDCNFLTTNLVLPSSAPPNPVAGSCYYDSTNNILKLYDGANWQDH